MVFIRSPFSPPFIKDPQLELNPSAVPHPSLAVLLPHKAFYNSPIRVKGCKRERRKVIVGRMTSLSHDSAYHLWRIFRNLTAVRKSLGYSVEMCQDPHHLQVLALRKHHTFDRSALRRIQARSTQAAEQSRLSIIAVIDLYGENKAQ